MLLLKHPATYICKNQSVAILLSSAFALHETASVPFNNSFHRSVALPYSQLLIICVYLSGACVIVNLNDT